MLKLKKDIEKNDIISIKLVTGEEIVAKFEGFGANDAYKLNKPMILAPTQNGLAFMPFMFSIHEDEIIIINQEKMVAISHARDEIKKAFIDQTSSILTPGTDSGLLRP